MNTPDIKKLNCTNIGNKYISKHYPEFYNFLTKNYKDCKSLSEKLYLYYNNLDKRPVCVICGSPVNFKSFFRGFKKYCCIKCRGIDPLNKEKRKQTNLERYGVENPFNSDVIKEKIKQTNLERYGFENVSQNEEIKEKRKQTNLERYGVENISQNEEIKEKKKQTNLKHYGVANPLQNDTIKEKVKQTNLERYGVGVPLQNNTIKEKQKQTNLERYGVEYILQNDTIKEKVKQTNLERYGVEYASQNKEVKKKIKQTNREINITTHPDLIRYTKNGDWVCKCPHPECVKCSEKKYVTNSSLYNNRKKINSELCTKLLPIQPSYSTPELQIRNFLDSLNIEYITNDRSIIPPKELDIYIPSKNIAIEFNGSYWHANKDKYYHQNKTIACYSKGILLIHIYEYEWNKDKESVLSKLKDILEDKEVDGIVSVKDYNKYTLSEPVLIDCGNYQYWNEGGFVLKIN